IFDQFVAQAVGSVENLLEHRLRAALEMDDLAPPIIGRFAPFDPTVLLETVEQTREGWPLNAHPLGDLLLRELVSTLGQVDERAPLPLAQAERTQALIEFGAPGTGGAEEQKTELVNVGTAHPGNWLAY